MQTCIKDTLVFSKWSKGETYDKTQRASNNVKETTVEENIQNKPIHTQTSQPISNNILELSDNTFEPNKTRYTRLSNKRNTHNELLLQRDPIIQTSINPFITRNDYVNDLNTEHDFLRPKDSNLEYDR